MATTPRRFTMRVFLNGWPGERDEFPYKPDDTIKSSKIMIATFLQTRPETLELKKEGQPEPLQDHLTLEAYGLGHQSAMDLEEHTREYTAMERSHSTRGEREKALQGMSMRTL